MTVVFHSQIKWQSHVHIIIITNLLLELQQINVFGVN